MITKTVQISSDQLTTDTVELLSRWYHYQAKPVTMGTTLLVAASVVALKDGVTLERFVEAAKMAYATSLPDYVVGLVSDFENERQS